MDQSDDITSTLDSLRNKIEDLEIRVGGVLARQLQTKKELDLIQEKPEAAEDIFAEDKIGIEFPDDYHFTEDLQKIMKDMLANQNAWLETLRNSKNQPTGLKGMKIFEEIEKHLTDRLQYIEIAKTLIEGPLLEDPPPPPEEPPVEEEPKVEKAKGKKGKKEDKKKK